MAKKRKAPPPPTKPDLDEMLGHHNAKAPAPTFEVPTIKAKDRTWKDLSNEVVKQRAAIVKHSYKLAGTENKESVRLSHGQNDFNKKLKSGEMSSHNIATSIEDKVPRSFPKIAKDVKTQTAVTDTLRVLKGTHLTEGLTSPTHEERQAAVELAGELGISEYTRGTNLAVMDAAVNLYRVKHGKLAMKDFSNPNKGYYGGGTGGANRVRGLGKVSEIFDDHDESLREIFDTKASAKAVRPWEAMLKPTDEKTADNHFIAWKAWKALKWGKRTGD